MTKLEALIAARKKIEYSENWCQGTLAMNAKFERVGTQDENAYRWCAAGAVYAVADIELSPVVIVLLDRQAFMNYGCFLTTINDTYGHAAVLRMFDLAIEQERATS